MKYIYMHKVYESLEDALEEKIFHDTIPNIEKFIRHPLSIEEYLDAKVLRASIRKILVRMTENDLLCLKRKYF